MWISAEHLFLLPCLAFAPLQEPLRGSGAATSETAQERAREVDPGPAGWSSEVWNERLGVELDHIARLLEPGAIDEGRLAQHLGASFEVVSLARTQLETVHTGPSFVVRRPPPGWSSEASAARPGAANLARAWGELFEGGVAPVADVHFKVVEIHEGGTQLEAGLWASVHARGESAPLQLNLRWRSWWERPEGDGAPRLARLELSSLEEIRKNGAPEPLFEDATLGVFGGLEAFEQQLSRGIDHWRRRIDPSLVIPLLAHPAGLVVGDVNGDALDDLYLCQPGGLPNRLFLRNADGSLTDASRGSGLDVLDFTRSALLLDLDADGDRDFVLAVMSDLVFFENGGEGEFRARVVHPSPETTSISAADYDGDGDLDLYACAYFGPYQNGAFPIPYHDANNGHRNLLLRNDGEWVFRDATQETGLEVNNLRFSFAASWEDYDADGDPDLYVANDFGRNNLYRNDGGHFEDVAREAGVEDISAGMGVSWADVDGDGWFDLHVSNMFSSAGQRVTWQPRFQGQADEGVRAEFQRHARGNSLFLNRGDGTFEDVSLAAGVTGGRWAWGSTFCDWNSDGLEDIFVPNGFLTQERDDDL